MKKTVQHFTSEYLQSCRTMSPEHILEFLENFRVLHLRLLQQNGQTEPTQPSLTQKSKLISIKVPEDLLAEFKQESKNQGVRYQTQIKILMKDWLDK